MNKNTIQVIATVSYQRPFWVGIFERKEDKHYAVARKVFGDEPTDPELYEFVLHNYHELKFSEPQKDIKLIIKRKNPKRVQREVRKEMEKMVSDRPMTRAQEVLKLELEKNKKIKKLVSKAEQEAKQKAKFEQKQQKKKQKLRGH